MGSDSGFDAVYARLDEWATAAEAATPGPWEADIADGISQSYTCPEPWLPVITMEGWDSHLGCNHWLELSEADAAFIVTSRTAVPTLIAAIRVMLDEAPPLSDEAKSRLQQIFASASTTERTKLDGARVCCQQAADCPGCDTQVCPEHDDDYTLCTSLDLLVHVSEHEHVCTSQSECEGAYER